MAEVAFLETERLCVHHEAERFSCGDPALDRLLAVFQDRFEAGEAILGFVAPGEGHEVLGYVILAETTLREPKSGRAIRCFTVPAMAVAKSHHGSPIFRALVQRGLAALAVRQANAEDQGASRYEGLVCMPGDNKVLERWLVGWGGFQSLGEGLYWIRLGDVTPES